jgi:hypothetical protein
VRELLPEGWNASLLAFDGATASDVPSQVRLVPPDATHLVLSAGGNDVLCNVGMLDQPVNSTAQAITTLADIAQDFEEKYRGALASCRALRLPLTICTIYNGCFPDADYQRMASTALTVFNDVILRVGIEFGLSIIDLRFVCSSPKDYANPIEPSSIGGAKIARSIVSLMRETSAGSRIVTA